MSAFIVMKLNEITDLLRKIDAKLADQTRPKTVYMDPPRDEEYPGEAWRNASGGDR